MIIILLLTPLCFADRVKVAGVRSLACLANLDEMAYLVNGVSADPPDPVVPLALLASLWSLVARADLGMTLRSLDRRETL